MDEQQTIEIEAVPITETWGEYEQHKLNHIAAYMKLALEYASNGNEAGVQAYIKEAQKELDYLKSQAQEDLSNYISDIVRSKK